MFKKMLLLTVATVAVYASSFERDPEVRRVASSSGNTPEAVDAQMQIFVSNISHLVQGLHEEKKSLTAQISHAQSEIERLSTAAQNAQLEAQRVQEQLATVQRDHQSALDAAKSSASADAQKKVAEIQAELEIVQSEAKGIVQQRDDYFNQIQLNKAEIESSRKLLSENDLALAGLQQELATFRISNEKLAAEKAEVASNLATLQSQLLEKQSELDHLSKSNDLASKEIARLQGELETTRNSGAASAAQIQAKAQEIADMQKTLAAADLQASQRLQEINALRSERDSQLRALTDQLAAVKGEHAALQERVAPYSNFMSKYESAKNSRSPIERTPSGIFDDAMQLGETKSALENMTAQAEAVRDERDALVDADKQFQNFKRKFNQSGVVPGMIAPGITRTPSGIFDDAVQLPETQAALAAAQQRLGDREVKFGEDMTAMSEGFGKQIEAMSQETEQLRAQLSGNSAALKELEDLRQAVSATAQAHQQAMDDYEGRLALMVPADQLDAANNEKASLLQQLSVANDAKESLVLQLNQVAQVLEQMKAAAAGNETIVAELRKQTEQLAAQKAEVERKAASDAQALKEADAKRAQELEVKRAERAAASRAVGIRTKADIDAERESAARAAAARTEVAAKIPTAVQLVPVWQFLRDIAVSTGIAPSLGLAGESPMNGMEGSANRNKLLNQTLSVKGKSITINGVEPKDIWPAIRKLAADLGVPNYDQLGSETLVQEIKKAAK